MNFESIPWAYFLPALVLLAFGGGLVYQRIQDKTVRTIRQTLKPGDLHVDDVARYAKTTGKTA